MQTPFHLVVAYDENRGIGYKNELPWRLIKDMAWFKQLTVEQFRTTSEPNNRLNAVIMGSRTWASIPKKFRPLPERLNIVLSKKTSKSSEFPEVLFCDDLNEALEVSQKKAANTFVIGGGMIFAEALKHADLESIFATEIEKKYTTDCFFPAFTHVLDERKVLFSEQEKTDGQIVKFSMVQYRRSEKSAKVQ